MVESHVACELFCNEAGIAAADVDDDDDDGDDADDD